MKSAQPMALGRVLAERITQDAIWGSVEKRDLKDSEWLPILMEEVGEVAKAILEGSGVDDEVTQVCAVALAWLESHLIERQK